MAGIKETQELIDGLAALALAVASQIKDGVQFEDIAELFAKVLTDAELSAKLGAAFSGVASIPAEAADLSWLEGIKLGSHVLGKVKEIGEALK